MDLPVISVQPGASPEELVRAAMRSRVILARTAAEETVLDGATVLTNPKRPGDALVNLACEIGSGGAGETDNADALIELVLGRFSEAGTTCHAMYDGLQWPAPMREAVERPGYHRSQTVVHRLVSYRQAENTHNDLQIVPARSCYRDLGPLFTAAATGLHHARPEAVDDVAATLTDHLDEPRLELFLGRVGGQAVGYCGLVTLGQTGVLYNAFVHPDHRAGGYGRHLLAHTLDHCVRAQFQQVIVELPPGCPATPLYKRAGFVEAVTYDWYRAAGDAPR